MGLHTLTLVARSYALLFVHRVYLCIRHCPSLILRPPHQVKRVTLGKTPPGFITTQDAKGPICYVHVGQRKCWTPNLNAQW